MSHAQIAEQPVNHGAIDEAIRIPGEGEYVIEKRVGKLWKSYFRCTDIKAARKLQRSVHFKTRVKFYGEVISESPFEALIPLKQLVY
jgi:hypothetical protein